MLLPGATLGVMGGGQLGRMFAVEALRMGYKVIVYDPDARSPAGLIATRHICADYKDTPALLEMVDLCDAITIEFENLPLPSLEFIENKVKLAPAARCVKIAQNRILEKTFFAEHGLNTPAFAAINEDKDIEAAVEVTGFPCIIKTAQFGYDGKGQAMCHSVEEVEDAFRAMGQVPCVLEQKINLDTEVSVILVCSPHQEIAVYPVAENKHNRGILEVSSVPADVSRDTEKEAIALAKQIALKLEYIGVLAVELFVSDKGEVLVNEIAPRPHNSGHFTQDATATSQFEQQVRMMCGLPAGSTSLHSPVAMLNLLGDLWGDSQPRFEVVFSYPSAKLHLYNKFEARPARKMGHINILGENARELCKLALQLKQQLNR